MRKFSWRGSFFQANDFQGHLSKKQNNKNKQGDRGDKRKIHVKRQFFEASRRHGDFFEKTYNPFLDKV